MTEELEGGFGAVWRLGGAAVGGTITEKLWFEGVVTRERWGLAGMIVEEED